MNSNLTFQSPTIGELQVSEMISEIKSFVREAPERNYRLVIGTDSLLKHTKGKPECDFVTAIVIHREGAGARYFYSRQKVQKTITLRDKIYTETMRSLDTAHALVPDLAKSINPSKYELEIHIDVGQVGETRDMIREVVGMVTGNGFVAKTKPDSWAASSVADKHT